MDAEKEISKINDEIMDTEMKMRQHMHKLKLEQAKAAYQKRMLVPSTEQGHIDFAVKVGS